MAALIVVYITLEAFRVFLYCRPIYDVQYWLYSPSCNGIYKVSIGGKRAGLTSRVKSRQPSVVLQHRGRHVNGHLAKADVGCLLGVDKYGP